MYFDIQACRQRIRKLRIAQGLTQAQVSTQLRIGDRHLRKIEQGVACGSIDFLVDIANYFGVTLDYLLLERRTPVPEELKKQIHELIDCLRAVEYGL